MDAGAALRPTAKDGKKIGNGKVHRVMQVRANGEVVLDNGSVLRKDFCHWNHAYCVTNYGSQGRTVNHVLVAVPSAAAPASSREGFYVAASRGRKTVEIWTNNRQELHEAAMKSRPRITATELLRRPRRPAWRCMRDTIARVKLNAMLKARTVTRSVPAPARVKEYGHAR